MVLVAATGATPLIYLIYGLSPSHIFSSAQSTAIYPTLITARAHGLNPLLLLGNSQTVKHLTQLLRVLVGGELSE